MASPTAAGCRSNARQKRSQAGLHQHLLDLRCKPQRRPMQGPEETDQPRHIWAPIAQTAREQARHPQAQFLERLLWRNMSRRRDGRRVSVQRVLSRRCSAAWPWFTERVRANRRKESLRLLCLLCQRNDGLSHRRRLRKIAPVHNVRGRHRQMWRPILLVVGVSRARPIDSRRRLQQWQKRQL